MVDFIEGDPVVVNPGSTGSGTKVNATTNPVVDLPPVDVTAQYPANNPTAQVNPSPAYAEPTPAGGDDLTLIIGNTTWSGWQRVMVTRSLETVPANFDIMITERYPNLPDIDVRPGVSCQVMLGGDLVLTGYVDRYSAQISASDHTVQISGRSKSADLVDCAAFVGDPDDEVYTISGNTVLAIAQQLAAPYGIQVSSNAGPGRSVNIPAINFGETPWEIIDRLTKTSSLLAYDLPDGNILLAQAGNEAQASGFTQGVNVELAEVNFTMDQRYSLYLGFTTATPVLTTNMGGHVAPQWKVTDPGVPRFRKRIIVTELSDINGSILAQRVQWEANRRAARSQSITITCDSWRDTANNLWTPNHLAPINMPALKVAPSDPWCIGQVSYTKDERGRHATVLLMPKDAFVPEPTPYLPLPPTLSQQGRGVANPTSANPADAPAGYSDTTNPSTGQDYPTP
jgi:prophage tail gpP-like protein